MTAIEAYVLAKKIALGAVSGIKNLTFNGNQIIFNFNDGSHATMTVPLPQDGISITKVEIDASNHLICTMSDGSTQDAGEIPGGKGGGLIQVNSKSNLPAQGANDTLYLTKDDDTLYYWDGDYKPISGGDSANSINIKTSSIEFDGIETTFALPVDNKDVMIYVNGMYLTEDEDYTIDKTVSPNTVTFIETWEETDICSLVWIKGSVSGSGEDINITLATTDDIDKLFSTSDSSSPNTWEDVGG